MPHESNSWIDFRYGTNYASDFGLLRVSNSSRYNENLIPTLTDKTAEVPGGDGTYYFNSYYKQKQFNINFAYDNLTETQLRQVRNWLNGKEIKELEFDEREHYIYFAKVTGSPSFKYIPFDTYDHKSNNTSADLPSGSGESELIYKGEGSVTFTCYDPYSYSEEITYSTGVVGGDLPTNFIITSNAAISANTTITLTDTSSSSIIGTINVLIGVGANKHFTWNGKTGLVSCDDGAIKFTGNSMVTIAPDQILSITGLNNAVLTYRKRY